MASNSRGDEIDWGSKRIPSDARKVMQKDDGKDHVTRDTTSDLDHRSDRPDHSRSG